MVTVPVQVVPVEQPAPEKTKEAEPELAPFAMPPYAWAPMYVAPTPTESPDAVTPVADGGSLDTEVASSPLLPGITAVFLALLATAMVVIGKQSRGPKGVSAPSRTQ